MKVIKLSPSEQKIFNILQVGKDNAVTRDTLVQQTGINDRTIRNHIRDMRLKGIRIVSYSTHKGYWISGSREDDIHYANEMRKRGQLCKDIVRGINISLGKTKHRENQTSIFDEGEPDED